MPRSCPLLMAILAALGAPPATRALEPAGGMTPESRRAVDQGLAFLEKTQNRDGSWGESNRVGKTAVICMAFMAGGSSLRRGPHAKTIEKGLEYILSHGERRRGHLTDETNNWADVHNHGYALLFLALLCGMEPNLAREERIRDLMDQAIRRSLASQARNGGWGYGIANPGLNGFEDEGSCSVTQIQALRACLAVGIAVPKEPIDRAVEYLRKCRHPSGGFIYSLSQQTVGIAGDTSKPGFAITAAALSVLNSSGMHRGPMVDEGLTYLRQFCPGEQLEQSFFYYGHFYAAQVMMNAGGKAWAEYYPVVRERLLRLQGGDGAWQKTRCTADPWEMANEMYGIPHLSTAFALIVLQAPQRCLPILTE